MNVLWHVARVLSIIIRKRMHFIVQALHDGKTIAIIAFDLLAVYYSYRVADVYFKNCWW